MLSTMLLDWSNRSMTLSGSESLIGVQATGLPSGDSQSRNGKAIGRRISEDSRWATRLSSRAASASAITGRKRSLMMRGDARGTFERVEGGLAGRVERGTDEDEDQALGLLGGSGDAGGPVLPADRRVGLLAQEVGGGVGELVGLPVRGQRQRPEHGGLVLDAGRSRGSGRAVRRR